jgi:mono/diheme cytochrome c family protein
MRRLILVPALVLAGTIGLVVAACGGQESLTTAPETVVGTLAAPTTTQALPKGNPANGKQVFTSAGCGGCHTLADAGSTGNVGPNLDQAKPTLQLALTRVINGASPMPSFKGTLTNQQIADVATYVVQATSGK